MASRRSTVLLTAIVVLFLGACRTGRNLTKGEAGSPFPAGAGADEVTVHVTNLAFSDVTLYAVTTGTRERLGVITGKREDTFTFSLDYATEIYLELDFLAGRKCFTERLPVDPGDAFDLVIQQEGLNLRCSGGFTATG